MKDIFVQSRFYYIVLAIVIIFISGIFYAPMYYVSWALIALLLILTFYDWLLLHRMLKFLSGKRVVTEKLSLGDFQHVVYKLSNQSDKDIAIELIDELPFQLQHRSEIYKGILLKHQPKTIEFDIQPVERGNYDFGALIGYFSNPKIGLLQLRKYLDQDCQSKVYPSIIQMKKYALHVIYKAAHMYGIRKIRTVGENDEFEHIRNYLLGDNEKSINWKATSRKGELLVNQYQDTRSQNVYCIIDKGRTMEMPFNRLTLLDHSINTALVLSNITLHKYDKAGLITFCDKIDAMVNAESTGKQMEHIMESLYAQQSVFRESNFELLYLFIRKKISKRSILFLFTNFENQAELQRNIDYLRLLSKQHILIVIMFINTELYKKTIAVSNQVFQIYEQTIAQSLLHEKENLATELNNYGIQTILTKPEDLSINVINKYLEIKARRIK